MGRRHIPTEDKANRNAPYVEMLQAYMARAKCDQNEVARRLSVNHGTVSRWLTGGCAVTAKHAGRIEAMCAALAPKNEEARHVAEAWAKLPKDQQGAVLSLIRSMLASQPAVSRTARTVAPTVPR